MYFEGGQRVIKRNVTLKEAQNHCRDPETSSKTCTSYVGKARTKRLGAWFDGYDSIERLKGVRNYYETKNQYLNNI